MNIPGNIVRINSVEQSKLPYCNLSESQFSFHGHRNAIKFFLSVPSEAFQRLKSTTDKQKLKDESYEKVETNLILSGGHGYIDFRIGDTGNKAKHQTDAKITEMENTKSERAHLIVWQLNSN